jgi:methylglutamate dehydrogenase subunit D
MYRISSSVTPRRPLEDFLEVGRHRTGSPRPAGVVLQEHSRLAVVSVQARRSGLDKLIRQVGERFGIDLPMGPKRVAVGPVAFVGVGPDKWLALREQDAGELARELAEALGGLASIVDQSDAFAVVRISGPNAREALQRALPIDLHPCAFRPDEAVVTSMVHLGVTLWQPERGSFELAVPRSYARDLAHTLLASAAAFGVSTLAPI